MSASEWLSGYWNAMALGWALLWFLGPLALVAVVFWDRIQPKIEDWHWRRRNR